MKSECIIVFIDGLPRTQAACLRNATAGWTEAGWQVRLVSSAGLELPDFPREVEVTSAAGVDARSRTTAVVAAFAAGIEALVIIDQHALGVPHDFIRLAFDNLSSTRAVAIGPSAESFYIVALNDLFPDLIAATAKHEQRFEEVLAASSEAGSITILPAWMRPL